MNEFRINGGKDVQIWQKNLARQVRTGHYKQVDVVPHGNLFCIKGMKRDGTYGEVVAKYSTEQYAKDALGVINRLSEVKKEI